MKLVYVGESPGRNIVVDDGVVAVTNGVPFEIDDAVAQSLLEQDIFEAAPKTQTKKEVA